MKTEKQTASLFFILEGSDSMVDSVNRMTGFASGMDINQMVRDLMDAERQPLQPMQQNAVETQLKIDEYREMNRRFSEFRNDTFDGVLRRSNMQSRETTSSNESALSASASAATPEGTYTISDAVTAKSERRTSDFGTTNGTGDGGSFLDDAGAFDRRSSFLTQADNVKGLDGTETELSFALAVYDENGDQQTTSFSFDATDSLDDIVDEVNRSGAGVQLFYDDFSGRMSMQRSDTGVYSEGGKEIRFGTMDGETFAEADDGALSTVFGFSNNDTVETEASNASFRLNGLDAVERRSNTFDVNGVTMTLNQDFTEEVQVGVSSDTDRIVDTVMSFVEDYNDMVETTQDKVSEEYFRDYAPLTEEQRRELSESEVELWEERSNSGLLQRDSILQGAISNMRSQFYETVDADIPNQTFNQIAELGITTSSDFRRGGVLEVDEEQLRAAVEEDPESVYQMFAADGDTPAEQGIARRLRDTLDNTITQIGERAGRTDLAANQSFTLGRELESQEDDISNFERRMQQVEDRYWSQFTAMEKAMADANSQMQQLMSQMGGGGQMM
ncbi:flagellar filament capping protein FliD [Alkalicoccus urumqiensis]|uniref:flagellar filament capping protein FliD n=1 Tax=Alkalicoccus urumqiensis TaxID=1548213 RepID=UPI0015E5A7C1|nr:flagellar filament capping protein FliD [Alkalicoccus urumqiensis]